MSAQALPHDPVRHSTSAWILRKPDSNASNAPFDAIIGSPSGVVFAASEYADSWRAVRHLDQRISLHIPELLPELAKLDASGPPVDAEYPFVLSAGERRSDTSNTSIRDPGWYRKGPFGTLRLSPQDAARLGCVDGDWVRVSTRRGSAQAPVEITSELEVSALLRELIVEATRIPIEYEHDSRDGRVMTLIVDEIRRARTAPLHVPMPQHAQLLRICHAILKDPTQNDVLDDWAVAAGMCRRTFTRLFRRAFGVPRTLYCVEIPPH